MNLMLTQGNALQIPLADESVHCVVTSPPYFSLRDYGIDGQLGMEASLEEYIENMVMVFREVKRVMRHDTVLFLNMGDSYAGSGGAGGDYNEGGLREGQTRYKGTVSKSKRIERGSGRWGGGNAPASGYLKPKDLMGVPWRLAFALQADGWWLRSDNPWIKNNPMPESADDRPNKCIEYMFLLTKSAHYYFDMDAVRISTAFSNTHSRGTKLSPPKEAANAAAGYGHKDWTKYTSEQVSERNWRNHDLFLKSIQHILDGEPTMLVDDDKPIATFANTRGYSGAHFATFPPALVEPCIKAGTSERGVCPECKSPWVRYTEKTTRFEGGSGKAGTKAEDIKGKWGDKRYGENILLGPVVDVQTLGWRPTCDHDAEPVSATVFDPFIGSGTTLQVARALGRNGIGLDLSLEYLHLARKRLSLDALDAWGKAKKDDAVITDLPMFEESR